MRKLAIRATLAAALVLGLVGANVAAAPGRNNCGSNGFNSPHGTPPGLSKHCPL
jgi:hypothetical protein